MGNSRCPDAATSGFYNKLSFGWMNNVVKKARQGECKPAVRPLKKRAYRELHREHALQCQQGLLRRLQALIIRLYTVVYGCEWQCASCAFSPAAAMPSNSNSPTLQQLLLSSTSWPTPSKHISWLPTPPSAALLLFLLLPAGDVDVHELPLPTPQTADVAYEEFQVRWDAAVKEGRPNLRKVLWSTFGKDLMIAGLFKLVWSVW